MVCISFITTRFCVDSIILPKSIALNTGLWIAKRYRLHWNSVSSRLSDLLSSELCLISHSVDSTTNITSNKDFSFREDWIFVSRLGHETFVFFEGSGKGHKHSCFSSDISSVIYITVQICNWQNLFGTARFWTFSMPCFPAHFRS